MRKILIQNGRVWDGHGFSQKDVYWEYDRIVAVEPSLSCDAQYVVDARGKIVTAGLVDVHAHLRGLTTEDFAAHADLSCLPFGVTAVAEAGCSIPDKALAESFMTRTWVFCKVPIRDNQASFDKTQALLEHYGNRALGIKLYFDTAGGNVRDVTPIVQACEFARARNCKVMVHCTNSPIPMAQLVQALNPGDIISHAYHGGVNSAAEDNFACLHAAKEKGVLLDAAFAGATHVDFQVFADAVKAGALPDAIGTDLTRRSIYIRGGRYGMTQCMTMARTMGMEEADIFRCVTSGAARVLDIGDLGLLAPGKKADLALLEWTDAGFDLTDKAGHRLTSSQGYRCTMTVADGNIVYTY